MARVLQKIETRTDSSSVPYRELPLEATEPPSSHDASPPERLSRRRVSLSGGRRLRRLVRSLRQSLADPEDGACFLGTSSTSSQMLTKSGRYAPLDDRPTEPSEEAEAGASGIHEASSLCEGSDGVEIVLQRTSSLRTLHPCPTKTSDRPVTVYDRYILKDQIGVGGFSKVFKANHHRSGKSFAIKRIQSSLLSDKDRKHVKSEVSILRSLNHPSIIAIHDVFHTDPEYVYLVMERVRGGELYNCIVDHGTLSESNARLLCQSILRAVKYCHDQNVVHRDLKPENILLVSKNSYDVKICDFGCAGRLREGFLSTFCGTINYMSPEMAARRYYDTSVDIWSLGVILFVCLVGYLPFQHDDLNEMRQLIIRGEVSFEGPTWATISHYAKELIGDMMDVDPLTRVTADMALLHPWSSLEPRCRDEEYI